MAHGLRLGYVVAPAALVRELRALRRLVMRHVATNNQQVAASFIAHGHHEAYVRKLNLAYRERSRAVHDALRRHAPTLTPVTARGGSAVWVTGAPALDGRALAAALYPLGVVVEPGDVFYAAARQHHNQLRIGYSSIATERIDAGIRLLADALAKFE